MKADRKKWDEIYGAPQPGARKGPNSFLKKHLPLLRKGRAIDLAAGEGQNAVFLAANGFEAEAVDISPVALRRARELARKAGVHLWTVEADLDHFSIERQAYDLITVFYFLNRKIISRIKKGLKPGGRIVYETYLLDETVGEGPKNPDYLLKHNELLSLFADFRILLYREGIFREPRRKAIASLIAEKV